MPIILALNLKVWKKFIHIPTFFSSNINKDAAGEQVGHTYEIWSHSMHA